MAKKQRLNRRGTSILAIREKIRYIININEAPHRVALSLGVGLFIGMSPFLGFHTIIGIAIAWIFKLNKFITIIGVYVTNPWTIVPIYAFATWVGAKLLNMQGIIPDINWEDVSLYQIVYEMKSLLAPFLLGTTLLGLISGIAGYIIVYILMNRYRKGYK